MREVVLGIDTSCYTTSVACADVNGELVCSLRKLLSVESGQCGLRQSEAVFVHIRQLPQLMEEMGRILRQEEGKIVGVCVSSRPRDVEDSYMPVFTAGYSLASSLSSLLGVPLFQTDHQHGHIAAGFIGNREPEDSYGVIHMSGGTTELLVSRGERLILVGGSLDLHAGQLLDRFGVGLGFPFPAGAKVEELALSCPEEPEGLIPMSLEKDGLHCHLSGAENKAAALLASGLGRERVAGELFDFLARTFSRMLETLCRERNISQALIVGGVSSSTLLRRRIRERLKKRRVPLQVIFGDPRYSSDNAAGVAVIGAKQVRREREEGENGADS